MLLTKRQSNFRPRSRMPGLLSALLSCHKVTFVGHYSEINTQMSITKNIVRTSGQPRIDKTVSRHVGVKISANSALKDSNILPLVSTLSIQSVIHHLDCPH